MYNSHHHRHHLNIILCLFFFILDVYFYLHREEVRPNMCRWNVDFAQINSMQTVTSPFPHTYSQHVRRIEVANSPISLEILIFRYTFAWNMPVCVYSLSLSIHIVDNSISQQFEHTHTYTYAQNIGAVNTVNDTLKIPVHNTILWLCCNSF